MFFQQVQLDGQRPLDEGHGIEAGFHGGVAVEAGHTARGAAEGVPLAPPVALGARCDAAVVLAEVARSEDFVHQVFAQTSAAGGVEG